jgi:hypothetical protein
VSWLLLQVCAPQGNVQLLAQGLRFEPCLCIWVVLCLACWCVCSCRHRAAVTANPAGNARTGWLMQRCQLLRTALRLKVCAVLHARRPALLLWVQGFWFRQVTSQGVVDFGLEVRHSRYRTACCWSAAYFLVGARMTGAG